MTASMSWHEAGLGRPSAIPEWLRDAPTLDEEIVDRSESILGRAPARRVWPAWQTWDVETASPGPRHGPRVDRPDGTKIIPWPAGAQTSALIYFANDEHVPPPPGSRVVLAEGEKTADAIQAAGLEAAGTMGTQPPHDAVVALLARYEVVLCPDADEVGRQAMDRLARRLERAGVARLWWCEPPPGVDQGWDLADVEDAVERRQLVKLARLLPLVPNEAETGGRPEFELPEDRGLAAQSELGGQEYVEDLIRPGRVVVVAAEEGTGKSYAISGELAIRVAVAGGSFAGTWPVLRTGSVLVLSEMHADDDFEREATILGALDLDRSALCNRYFRLPLMTAAGNKPALLSATWMIWITDWLRAHDAVLLVIDTATGASQVDPWGRDIQAVYRSLRTMLEAYPALAIVLIVHMKKPQGKGDRRLSDVLGEWGRWNDVTVLMEHDGPRTKLSTRKRIHRERRIVATKRDGLLVDPIDLGDGKGAKVPEADVLAAIGAEPGLGYAELAAALKVSKDTATRYVRALGSRVDAAATGKRGAVRLFLTAALPHGAA